MAKQLLLCIRSTYVTVSGSKLWVAKSGSTYTLKDKYVCPCGRNPSPLIQLVEVPTFRFSRRCSLCWTRVFGHSWCYSKRFVPINDPDLKEVPETYKTNLLDQLIGKQLSVKVRDRKIVQIEPL